VAAGFGRGNRFDLAIGVPGESKGRYGDAGAVNVLYRDDRGYFGDQNDQFWWQASDGVRDEVEPGDEFGAALAN
jgi:hypothetical protein